MSDLSPQDAAPSGARALAESLETRLNASAPSKRLDVVSTVLKPLLGALGWSGDDRFLIEAAPHMSAFDTFDEARALIHRLGFTSATRVVDTLNALSRPTLVEDAQGALFVFLPAKHGGSPRFLDFTSEDAEQAGVAGPYRLAQFQPVERAGVELTTKDADWFRFTTSKLHHLVLVAFGLSLAVNVLTLTTPLFVSAVYDKVMRSNYPLTLVFLLVAVGLTLHVEGRLRALRGRLIAHVGAKFDAEVALATQAKILGMPLQKTGSASVQSQLALLRKFEAFRDVFSGHIANTAVDLPFTVIFLGYIALVGGLLVLVPISVAILFALIVLAYRAALGHAIAKSGALRNQAQMLRLEILQRRRTIYDLGVEDIWLRRFAAASVKAQQQKFRTQFLDNALHTTAQSMMSVAGAITLGAGALLVMHDKLTVGALIGVMIVVWRVLTPIQITVLSLSRIDQMRESIKHLNQLMKIPSEENPARPSAMTRRFRGAVSASGVSFRASPDSEPLLRGVDVEFKAGAATALAGPDASAKSTLFKLALDLYRPQLGTIMIDGVNILQIPRRELRASIAYQPAHTQFFYGTVAQNLRLANPTASDDDVRQALTDAGFAPDDPLILRRDDLRLDFSNREAMPPRVKQMLALARAYVKKSSVYFFDEPDRYLDGPGIARLVEKITALKSDATLLVATSDLSLIRACDNAAVFVGGRVVAAGPAADIAVKLERAGQPRQSAA